MCRARYGEMPTVSRDDTLTVRSANPRTGLITPYTTSDSDNGCSGYVGFKSQLGNYGNSPCSGQWKQINGEWISVPSSGKEDWTIVEKSQSATESYMNHGNAQSTLHMQMARYEANVRRALLRQERLLESRTTTVPQGLATHIEAEIRKQPRRIKRKEVGNGQRARAGSKDTVAVNPQVLDRSSHSPSHNTFQNTIQWKATTDLSSIDNDDGPGFERPKNSSPLVPGESGYQEEYRNQLPHTAVAGMPSKMAEVETKVAHDQATARAVDKAELKNDLPSNKIEVCMAIQRA